MGYSFSVFLLSIKSRMFKDNIYIFFTDSKKMLMQHKRAVTRRNKKRIINTLESTSKTEPFELLYSATTHHTPLTQEDWLPLLSMTLVLNHSPCTSL